ncbi:MAG: M50 family metallopeptidase [Cyanobacteria bacterium SZAS-4]|nr:M50 family metallopeptidase [Cyanobacteria bacterium SZAS-4]
MKESKPTASNQKPKQKLVEEPKLKQKLVEEPKTYPLTAAEKLEKLSAEIARESKAPKETKATEGKQNITGSEKSNAWAFWLITILSLFLYNAPIVGLLLSPISTFATMVHEMSHAIVCLLTGGHVSGMTIVSDGSGHGGLTFCKGGWPFFYTQAGYLGAAVFGCLLIFLGQFQKISKGILMAIGGTIGLASIFLVGANVLNTGWQGFFSLIAGLSISGFLIWAGIKWRAHYANLLLLFLAVQTALNSVTSIIFLAQVSLGMVPFDSFSDASSMEQMTGLPAGFWSVMWVLASVLMLGATLYFTYGRNLVKKSK